MSAKLGIVISHPVQYYAPLFKFMAKSIDLKVFYGHNPNADEQGKSGFGHSFNWDVNLLEGYDYTFVSNRSKSKYFHTFFGIDVPDVGTLFEKEEITHVLILGWHYKFYIQALIAAKKRSIPVAVRGDSQIGMQRNPIIRLVKNIVYPLFLKSYDRFLFVGTRNKEYLKSFGISELKLIFSPHAVDQSFWKGSETISKNNRMEFLWVGKFIEKKRPLDVLKAFESYSQNFKDSVLTMVGTGPLMEECKQHYSHLKNVTFAGFKNQRELKAHYTRAHCLILSSDARETWGLVVNEAFSVGIPAIVSDSCGCAMDLIDGYSGLKYKVGNINELVKRMNQITTMLLERPDLIKTDIERINQTYSFSLNLEAIQKFMYPA